MMKNSQIDIHNLATRNRDRLTQQRILTAPLYGHMVERVNRGVKGGKAPRLSEIKA